MNLGGRSVAYWREEIKSNFENLRFIRNFNSIRYVLFVISLNVLLILLIVYLINTKNWALYFPIYIAVGYTYYQYQFILHEASHAVLFSSRRVNDFMGFCFGIVTGYTFTLYRSNHMKHHKYLGTDLDPENGNFIKEDKNKISYLLIRSFFGFDAIKQFSSFLRKNQAVIEKKRSTVGYSIVLYLTVSYLIFLINNWRINELLIFDLMLVLPVVTLTFFLNRLRTILEHPLGLSHRDSLFTTTHSKGILWNYVLASFNFNYHIEHHLMPEISSLYYPRINDFLVASIEANKALK